MQLFENDWSSLPLEYWLCAILLIVATVVALRQRHLLWVPPFLAVIGTIAAWYMVEPLYYDDFFLSFSPTDVAAGYRCLLVFVVTFVILSPMAVRALQPARKLNTAHQVSTPPHELVPPQLNLWLFLLGYGNVQ